MDRRLKGDAIPSDDHLAIHCQPSHFLETDAAGEAVSVSSAIFRVDDDGISTNWIEFAGTDFDGQFAGACLLLTSNRTVRAKHRVGVLVVSDILETGTTAGTTLSAIHDPLEPPIACNPGHALIVGVAADDEELLHDLSVITQLRPFTEEAIRRAKEAELAKKRERDAPR